MSIGCDVSGTDFPPSRNTMSGRLHVEKEKRAFWGILSIFSWIKSLIWMKTRVYSHVSSFVRLYCNVTILFYLRKAVKIWPDEKSEDHQSRQNSSFAWKSWMFAPNFTAIHPTFVEIFQSWPKWWATWLDSAIPRVMNVFLLFYCNIFYCWSSKGASWGTEGAVNTTNICGLLFLTIDVYLTVTRTSGSLVHAVHKAPFTNKFRALCLYLCQCLAAHRHA